MDEPDQLRVMLGTCRVGDVGRGSMVMRPGLSLLVFPLSSEAVESLSSNLVRLRKVDENFFKISFVTSMVVMAKEHTGTHMSIAIQSATNRRIRTIF